MSNIEKYGFHVVPNAVGKETCELISRSLLLFRSNYNYENNLSDESHISLTLILLDKEW